MLSCCNSYLLLINTYCCIALIIIRNNINLSSQFSLPSFYFSISLSISIFLISTFSYKSLPSYSVPQEHCNIGIRAIFLGQIREQIGCSNKKQAISMANIEEQVSMANIEEMLRSLMAKIDEQAKKFDRFQQGCNQVADRLESTAKEKNSNNCSSGGLKVHSSFSSSDSHISKSEANDCNWGKNSIHFNLKDEFPVFDGKNPRIWIKKCAKYFSLYSIHDEQKVELASKYLQGEPRLWFESYSLFRTHIFWVDFMIDIRTRFKDEVEDEMIEEISEPSSSRTPSHVQEDHELSSNSITDTSKTLLNEPQGSAATFVPSLCFPECTVGLDDGKIFKELRELQGTHKVLEEMPKRPQVEKLDGFEKDDVDLEISNMTPGSKSTSHVSETKEEEKPDTYGTTMSEAMGAVLTYRHESETDYTSILPYLIVSSCIQTLENVNKVQSIEAMTDICCQQDPDLEYFGIDIKAIKEYAEKFDGIAHIHSLAGMGRTLAVALVYMYCIQGKCSFCSITIFDPGGS